MPVNFVSIIDVIRKKPVHFKILGDKRSIGKTLNKI